MNNRSNKQLGERLATFVRLYSRRAQRGVEPNDRRYDRKVEQQMRQLDPAQLSALLHEDEAEEPAAVSHPRR